MASPLVAAWSAPGPTIPGRSIYVTNQLDNTLSVIDGSNYKVVATVPVGTSPAGVVVSPDGRYAYIAEGGDDAVSVLDTGTRTIATTVALPAGSGPRGVALSPRGEFLYVADGGSNRVSVVDTRTTRVVASVPVGTQPVSVAVTPDGGSAYVADAGSGNVSVIDTQTNRTLGVVATGEFPAAKNGSWRIPAGNCIALVS